MTAEQKSGDQTPQDDFDEDLYSVTEEIIKPWIDIDRVKDDWRLYWGCEVRIQDQKAPLLTIHSDVRYHLHARSNQDKTIVFRIKRFLFEGTPEEVEKMIESAAKLFDRPPLYPFRWTDIPDVEQGRQ